MAVITGTAVHRYELVFLVELLCRSIVVGHLQIYLGSTGFRPIRHRGPKQTGRNASAAGNGHDAQSQYVATVGGGPTQDKTDGCRSLPLIVCRDKPGTGGQRQNSSEGVRLPTNVETFAVHNSYAQDDWVRFGSDTQTRGSNIEGPEFRAVYGLADKMNLVARLYIVDAIDRRSATATRKEDGNRFRLDFNYKF